MKAVRVHTYDGPAALRVDEVEEPKAGAGEVLVEVKAAGVKEVAVGDRVATTLIHGAFAERIVVPEMATVKLPDAVSFEVGAATLLTYLTDMHALVDRAALRSGETLLVL